MKLTLGFSPCPNDTFIFDALIHHKIDTEGLEFEVVFDDVETLNKKAFKAELDVTKLSYHAFAYALKDYVLLDAGSALGFGVGPMLICKVPHDLNDPNLRVGIPGKYTTANFLLSLAYPHLKNKKEMVFSDIEQKLINNEIDVGLIIHENRFTYQNKGLIKVKDLGEYWEETTDCAIPLGGIVIKRSLSDEIKQKVNQLIRKSVEFAFENPKSALPFIKQYAQEMEESVMYQHIDLYVNKYSVNLGDEGKKAIKTMFNQAFDKKIIPNAADTDLFLNS
ncbi:MAG: 1,4-dihydroxy-6-naphthoate synthase [Bacteroidetes bacterium]|nr:1,4-dihydroxy-6-naphthoate synthase [Bacteroidota bacterium]MBU1371829.1 1,4-dihydroxy-6-naphthoate synthase [Bacteroidota bacterium]MBU1483286.1 1,4-dihydroxy-6-naphthoate synthase [Bacteroidota bacterium]MBU1759727.1 1,4-dihydroxy-6-naphthoate synthase [Bacteroidota bacterium]MBU2268257.1 1,4-dihydroxy-6-naphthoate synthase [Bacteroidota bacterium]